MQCRISTQSLLTCATVSGDHWHRAGCRESTSGGEVGDPSPIAAIEDELRRLGADEVIVVTHPSAAQSWQERGELERLQRELDLPVTHVVVGEQGGGRAGAIAGSD